MDISNGDATVLIVRDARKFSCEQAGLFHTLSGGGKECGIYISAAMPIENTYACLADAKIDTSRAIFIDVKNGGKPRGMECAEFISVSSPEDLTGISIALSKAYSAAKGRKIGYICLDSFFDITAPHERRMVEKFARYMVNEIRKKASRGAIVVIGKTMPADVNTICTVADKVIEV